MSERPGHTDHLRTSGELAARQESVGLDMDQSATMIGVVDVGVVGATKTCYVTARALYKGGTLVHTLTRSPVPRLSAAGVVLSTGEWTIAD